MSESRVFVILCKQILGVQFDAHVSRRWFLASLLSLGIDAFVTGPAFNVAAMLFGLFYGHAIEAPPHDESDGAPLASRAKVAPFPDVDVNVDSDARRQQTGNHLLIRVASAQSPTSSSTTLSPTVSASQQQRRLDAGLLAPRQAFSITPRQA
jgi:hypothetical protein